MTLRIHAPNPMRVGETANVLVTSDNPGVVSLTYGAGLTGPASVTIEGTRVWRRGIAQGFNGPSAAGAATAARDGVTICWDFDMSQFCDDFQNYSSSVIPSIPIASNYSKGAATNLFNWEIIMQAVSRAFLSTPRVQYLQTNAPPTAGIAGFSRALSVFSGLARFVMTLDNTTITVYWHDGTSKQSNTVARIAPSGNVNDPILAIYSAQRFAYFGSILSDDADGVDAWLAGNCPASPVVYYPCNEEVPDSITAAPYDASTNAYDGVFSGDATYPLTSAPRTYSDSATVVPYAIVPVTAVGTTGTTIDATRPRQGVPARASYSERTEVADQCVVTVNDPVGAVGPAITARVKL